MQLLRSLLKQISYESVRGDDDRKITDICCHSEKVKEGSLFVCINGYRNNGHEYVPQAVEHGAAVLVVDCLLYTSCNRNIPPILAMPESGKGGRAVQETTAFLVTGGAYVNPIRSKTEQKR